MSIKDRLNPFSLAILTSQLEISGQKNYFDLKINEGYTENLPDIQKDYSTTKANSTVGQ
jgi:hypothetical protein